MVTHSIQHILLASQQLLLHYLGLSTTYMQRLDILQKRASKIVCNLNSRTSSALVYSRSGALTIKEIYDRQKLIFMFKYFDHSLPEQSLDIFTSCSSVSLSVTRSNDCYYVYPPQLESTQRNIFFQGPNLWNNLDSSIQLLDCLAKFTRALKGDQ